MITNEYNADYTCPICLRVTKHNDRYRHDIGLRTYVMCRNCFGALARIRDGNVEDGFNRQRRLRKEKDKFISIEEI